MCDMWGADKILQDQSLSRSDWDRYVMALYNTQDTRDLALLPTIDTVDIVYRRMLPLPRIWSGECPQGGLNRPYREEDGPHPRGVAFFRKTTWPAHVYPSHSWAEVMHCSHEDEATAPWFFLTRGTGIFVNVGRTIAFKDHKEAALFFMGNDRPWGPISMNPEHTLTPYDGTMVPERARAAGYDSIQYTMHCEHGGCGFCMNELVLTSVDGSQGGLACPPVEFRTGPNASQPCQCQPMWGYPEHEGCTACSTYRDMVSVSP